MRQLLIAVALCLGLFTTLPGPLYAWDDHDSRRLYDQQRQLDQQQERLAEQQERLRADAYRERQYQERRDDQDRLQRQEDDRQRGSARQAVRPNLGRWP